MSNNSMTDVTSVFAEKVIDNRKISMVEAFKQILPLANHIDVAVGYFFLSGFESIDEYITEFMSRGGTMSILMGNITNLATGNTIHEGYGLQTKELLFDEIREIDEKSEKIPIMTKVRDWIAEKKIEVKIYNGTANYFHAKSYLFYRQDRTNTYDGISIVGSSNFTKSGFIGNTELNSVSQDNFGALTNWFHEIWKGDEVTDFSKELLNFIDEKMPNEREEIVYMHPNETYLLFSRYFVRRLPQDIEGDFMNSLYKHQKIGVAEIKFRLDQFGTSVLADGVGLGKTRTASATICAMNYSKVLILASKKLHDQWRTELSAVGVGKEIYTLMSKEEIARSEAASLTKYLDYDLIIVDEAHQGLKNNRTKLYRNLSYIKERSEKQVKGILLTATPWNNSRSDVFNLGRLFLSVRNIPMHTAYFPYLAHSPRKAAKAIVTDDKAFKVFWKDLFLQRTKKTYGGNDVQYAERKFPVVNIYYEPQKEKAFLANGERISNLHLPYMNPIRYLKGTNEEEFTADRLKMLFLKRADSSWKAFKDTLENVRRKLNTIHGGLVAIEKTNDFLDNFKEWLRDYYKLSVRDQYDGLFEDMDEEELSETLKMEQLSLENKEKHKIRLDGKIQSISLKVAKKMVSDMLKHAKQDLLTLGQIIEDFESAFNRKDEKYEKVRDAVLEYLQSGEKVLLISQFRSTVIDYYTRFMNEKTFQPFRLAQVTGNSDDWYIENELKDSKEVILECFSPRSKNKHSIIGTEDEVQLVIGTETLSVGQNLQDCRVLLNLDLPYNPMNLEQRIGRIDRPREDEIEGEINIVTFPSMPVIESELKMSERLKQKLTGIYQDTKFDDLVLPEYREFLQRVLKQRGVEQDDIEVMVENTIKSTIIDFAAEEHSTEYIESQKRMRKAIEEDTIINEKAKIKNCSFSYGSIHSIVASVLLKDVNGVKIDDYLIHLTIDKTSFSSELSKVEKEWDRARRHPLLYECKLNVIKGEELFSLVATRLNENILPNEVRVYNKRLKAEEELDNSLVDRKIRKVIVDITDQIRGRNKTIIAKKIISAGYEPKSIQILINQLQYIDRQYDVEEMELINELYENINLLWDKYAYYYDQIVHEEEFQLHANEIKSSIRVADLEHSKISWVVGNVGV